MKRIGSKSNWMMSWVIMLMTPSKFFLFLLFYFSFLLPLFVLSLPFLPVYPVRFTASGLFSHQFMPKETKSSPISLISLLIQFHSSFYLFSSILISISFSFYSSSFHPSGIRFPIRLPKNKKSDNESEWTNRERKSWGHWGKEEEVIPEKWKEMKCRKIKKNLKQQNQKKQQQKIMKKQWNKWEGNLKKCAIN